MLTFLSVLGLTNADVCIKLTTVFLQSGVNYVVSPGGSAQDAIVIKAANEHGMVLIHNGLRLFHH